MIPDGTKGCISDTIAESLGEEHNNPIAETVRDDEHGIVPIHNRAVGASETDCIRRGAIKDAARARKTKTVDIDRKSKSCPTADR